MMQRALIFDCDGVLADTELDGHLVAFNKTSQSAATSLARTPSQRRPRWCPASVIRRGQQDCSMVQMYATLQPRW